MRAVVQRVSSARVEVAGETVGEIGAGLLVLIGVRAGDSEADARELAHKLVHLRIFEDEEGRMNHSLLETGGALALVSQFTLYGDTRKGRRPFFGAAAQPDEAAPLIEFLRERIQSHGIQVATGQFGAQMNVHLTNSGPVTLILETDPQP
jgi:D-tyrosyl-tRNA(Tyr) deacylase